MLHDSRMKGWLIVVFMLLFLLMAGNAGASLITLDQGNSAISGYPGPYATVSVDVTDSTHATITATALSQPQPTPTYFYRMGDGSMLALNVTGTVALDGTFSWGGSLGTPAPALVTTPPSTQQVDSWGRFNVIVDDQANPDGAGTAVQSLTFTLQRTDGGQWATDESNFFYTNADNNQDLPTASHIFVYDSLTTKTALDTGYASVPIPLPVWLLGSGLLGLIGIRRRFWK